MQLTSIDVIIFLAALRQVGIRWFFVFGRTRGTNEFVYLIL